MKTSLEEVSCDEGRVEGWGYNKRGCLGELAVDYQCEVRSAKVTSIGASRALPQGHQC